jgi:plastocyanin
MGTLRSPPKTNESEQDNAFVLGLVAFVVVLLIGGTWLQFKPHPTAATGQQFLVSQRGREFNPSALTIHKGDVVRIVNDDGDLSHHAYVDADNFNFDSGDQEPGHDVLVVFDVPGVFNVLCGIHPKMRLVVTVK